MPLNHTFLLVYLLPTSNYVWFFLRELEVATQEHQEIQKKWEVHKRQLQETHNEAKKVPICR
jgi:hypothetical protein